MVLFIKTQPETVDLRAKNSRKYFFQAENRPGPTGLAHTG